MFVREFLHLTSRCPRSVEAGCAKSSERATSGNSIFFFGFQGKVASEPLRFLHSASLYPGMQLHVIIAQHILQRTSLREFGNLNGAMMSLGDGVNTKPAVHPSEAGGGGSPGVKLCREAE